MRLTRRLVLGIGGATLLPPGRSARAAGPVEIAMAGRGDGAQVWFDPIGIRIDPGAVVRWTNREAGNTHTATAYHPANSGRPRRMPAGAEPWDSGYLLPGDEFSVSLAVPGVYDFFCLPHEHAGMVGRIIVGAPGKGGWQDEAGGGEGVPEAALAAFPPIAEIMGKGVVRRA